MARRVDRSSRLAHEPTPHAAAAAAAALGSAKAQKKQKSELAKQLHPEHVFNRDQLSADLAGLERSEAPQPLTPQQARPLHPRFNLAAATPAEAYPRDGLIPPRAWEALDAAPLLASARDPAELARLEKDGALYPPIVL